MLTSLNKNLQSMIRNNKNRYSKINYIYIIIGLTLTSYFLKDYKFNLVEKIYLNISNIITIRVLSEYIYSIWVHFIKPKIFGSKYNHKNLTRNNKNRYSKVNYIYIIVGISLTKYLLKDYSLSHIFSFYLNMSAIITIRVLSEYFYSIWGHFIKPKVTKMSD